MDAPFIVAFNQSRLSFVANYSVMRVGLTLDPFGQVVPNMFMWSKH